MSDQGATRTFNFSLRELMGLFAALAGAFAALKWASGTMLAIIASVTMLAFMYEAIVAVVDRGANQAFALGFIVCGACYLTIFFVETEIHPFQARFPTSQLLRVAFERMREKLYVDEGTGTAVVERKIPANARVIEDNSWTITPPPSEGGVLSMPNYVTGSYYYSSAGSIATGTSFRRIGDVPPRQMFMPIGHFLWAMLFGYLGGRVGQFVYWRRVRAVNVQPK